MCFLKHKKTRHLIYSLKNFLPCKVLNRKEKLWCLIILTRIRVASRAEVMSLFLLKTAFYNIEPRTPLPNKLFLLSCCRVYSTLSLFTLGQFCHVFPKDMCDFKINRGINNEIQDRVTAGICGILGRS